MNVVFLDFDGVLNNREYITKTFRSFYNAWFGDEGNEVAAQQLDPEMVARLNQIMDAVDDTKVVICSSWRHMHSLEDIKWILHKRGFKHSDSVIDITPGFDEAPRGDEVRDWLAIEAEKRVVEPERDPVVGYVILDDLSEFDAELADHHVQTSMATGLQDEHVARAIAILKRGF